MQSLSLDVVVTRGDVIESRHRVHAAVVDTTGTLVAAARDAELVTFMRSCAKPLQVLPFVREGGPERFGWGDEEIALACASHGGEPEHVAVASRMLRSIGLDEASLACGPDRPLSQRGQRLLTEANAAPGRLNHNCSGKHAAMLARATLAGWATSGYERAAHPVQREALAEISSWSGVPAERIPVGVDGCTVSVFALPLSRMAYAYARLGDALVRDAGHATTIAHAMVKHPFLVGGTERFDTVLSEVTNGRMIAKVGAEGVHTVAIPDRGIGVALKVEDGALRAQHVATIALLRQMGELKDTPERLAMFAVTPVLNSRGDRVGEVRPLDEERAA
jgi:L-asparaginase II